MGTRAAFWLGDPRDLTAREWLGAKAWDGYPENPDLSTILKATTVDEFRSAVSRLASDSSREFAMPEGGWPYPWHDDIFLTDYTYAFFDDSVQLTCFHRGFITFSEYSSEDFEFVDRDDPSLFGIPAGSPYNPNQPDSILIIPATIPREDDQ